MNWTYKTYKERYKKIKRERDNLAIECDDKDVLIRKQKKIIQKLENANYELVCLINAKLKDKEIQNE